MGLTIHYDIKSRCSSDQRALAYVERMRQLALDLPFESVDEELVDVVGDAADFENPKSRTADTDGATRWLLIQANQSVRCPWNEHLLRGVPPSRVIAFSTQPGEGCEPANLGLCQYPREIEWKYKPRDDQRFWSSDKRRSGMLSFDFRRWERWLKRQGLPSYTWPDECTETRMVKTRLTGWRWSSFCKTQYASNPECGGVANFLKCHISVVTLLERIAKLPTMSVTIDDEGGYGPIYCSRDWQQAREEGREPTYRWWPGKYDPKALAEEVGLGNETIAAGVDTLGDGVDTISLESKSSVREFLDLERLKFRGSQDERLEPFLDSMKQLAQAAVGERALEKAR